jgi:hypothetical protein
MQDLWNTTERPNLQITDIDKGKEVQLKGIENIFNKVKP